MSARQLTDATSSLDYGVIPYVSGVPALSLFFRFNLDAVTSLIPASGTSKGLITIVDPVSGQNVVRFYYENNPAVGHVCLSFSTFSTSGDEENTRTDVDVFDAGGGTPISGWHTIYAEWGSGAGGTWRIEIDGVNEVSGRYIIGTFASLCTSSNQRLYLGASDIGPALVGMAWGEVDFFNRPLTSGEKALLNGGQPASAAIDPAIILDAGLVRGVTPETGLSPSLVSPDATTADGSITLASVVSGPMLGPEAAGAIAYTATDPVHLGATVVCDVSWRWGLPATGSVTFTPTCSAGTFSPATVTLTSDGASTGATTLTVDPAAALGGYTITWTNDGGLLDTSHDITVGRPVVGIAVVEITPDGNSLSLFFERIDPTTHLPNGVPAEVTGYAGGGTLDVDGVTINLTDPMFFDSAYSNLLRFPLNHNDIQIIDDGDPGCTLAGGTWTPVTVDSAYTNKGVWYGNGIHASDDPAATATFAYTGLIPGKFYVASGCKPFNDDRFAPIWGAGNTIDALWTGTTGATFHQDQTNDGTFDRIDLGSRWMDFFMFIAPEDGNYSIIQTNAAGSGTMRNDAVRVELLQSATVIHDGNPDLRTTVPGSPAVPATASVVTLTLPDSSVTAGGNTIGPTTALATLLDFATYPPFDPAAPRARPGYVQGEPGPHVMCQPFANRVTLANYGWGNANLDAGGNIVSIDSGQTATIEVASSSAGNGFEPLFGIKTDGPGTHRVQYDSTPDLTFSDLAPSLFGADAAIGGNTTGDAIEGPAHNPAAGHYDYKFPITYVGEDRYPYTTHSMELRLHNLTGGTLPVTGVVVTGTEVPDDWAHEAAPHYWTAFHGTGLASLRSVQSMKLQSSNISKFSDWEPTKQAVDFVLKRPVVIVDRIDPADVTGNSDGVNDWFGSTIGQQAIVKVHTTTDHFVVDGLSVNLNMFASFPDTSDGTGAGLQINGGIAYKVDDRNFLLGCYTSGANITPGKVVTLASAITDTTTLGFSDGGGAGPQVHAWAEIDRGLTLQRFVGQCNELDVDPYIHIPHCFYQVDGSGDDEIRQTFAYLRDNVAAGHTCRVAPPNEFWNGTGSNAGEAQVRYITALTHKLGLAGSAQAYATMAAHMYEIGVDEWINPTIPSIPYPGGRPRAELKCHVEGIFGGDGVTVGGPLDWFIANTPIVGGQLTLLDGISVAPYLDTPGYFQPGYNADASLGFARLDAQGLAYAAWLNTRHGGYLAGLGRDQAMINSRPSCSHFELNNYEGGWTGLFGPSGPGYDSARRIQRTLSAALHPAMYRVNLAWLSLIGTGTPRIKIHHRYSFDDHALLTPPYGTLWRDLNSPYDGIGTGTIGENGNPANPNGRVSQLLGAVLEYATPAAPVLSAALPTASVTLSAFAPGRSATGNARSALPRANVTVGARGPTGSATPTATVPPTPIHRTRPFRPFRRLDLLQFPNP